jgi:hypothetical protein
MADDNNSRYRSNDPYGRGPAPTSPANDPLAELARLIGRNDPFAEFGREPRPPAPRDTGPRYNDPPQAYGSEPAPRPGDEPPLRFGSDPAPHYNDPPQAYGSEPASRFGGEPLPGFGSDPAPQYNDPPQPYGSEPAARFGADDAPRYGNDQPAPDDWLGGAARAEPYPPADPFTLPLPKAVERHDDAQGFEGTHSGPALEINPPDRSGFDPAGVEPAPEPPPFAPPLYPHEPGVGSMPPPHDDEFYDDAPRSNRRKGLLTVAAVLGLAVIGTAGAFGYRNFFGGSGASSPPPVIRASGAPSKVAPPPSKTDQTASKFSYDRFSDRGKDERVVVRQEKPVDAQDMAQSSMARTTLPAASTAGLPGKPSPGKSSPGMPSNAGGSAAANPPSALGEPRRVRTVPIRPEEPDVATPAQPAALPPRQARVAAVAPVNAPTQLEPPPAAAPARPPAAARATSTRTVPQRPSPAAPAAPAANAPLSLSANSSNSSSALPPPSAPPPRAAAPTRLASAPSGGGGRYLVQVSSQRSEADAQSSFRSIQAKYSNVLDGQSHVVRRADLGSRGVYYRAMVGPFGTREQAIKLCGSLKAAGGDCVVQSN